MPLDHFATGLGAPEGPVCLEGGSMYVTEMSSSTLCVTRLDRDGGRHVVRQTAGRPNGLTTDGDGMLWVAEAGHRCVLCLTPDGREVRRIEGPPDVPFLFPNDLAFGENGLLYLTDSGMRLEDCLDGQTFVDDYMDLDWDGRVYEIDPKAGRVTRVLDRGLRFTNGIAFGPDGLLYANASFTGDVYRYDIAGTASPAREIFGNVLQEDDRWEFKGPDGMAFGTDGRLYCTVYNQANVTVLDANGQVAERLALRGDCPTNCAFALDGQVLRVTEVMHGRVESVAVPCAGIALHLPRLGLG